MSSSRFGQPFSWIPFDVTALSSASKFLMVYGALMWLACGLTSFVSLNDARTLREVGIWFKPMKFMAATAVFAWTTVWVTQLVNTAVTHGQAYKRISLLLFVTSLFEVVYITYQASHGAASHYNTSDPWHAFMFGLMAVAAVGLTASQGWLAWEIWKTRRTNRLTVTSWGAIIGLMLTFVLSTVSGFMLGGNQPPAGPGLPVVGWHLHHDIRPSHFLGVHAQQLIPLWGIFVDRFLRRNATQALVAGSCAYVMVWSLLTWLSVHS
jgi:branched-subunit amino acid permease